MPPEMRLPAELYVGNEPEGHGNGGTYPSAAGFVVVGRVVVVVVEVPAVVGEVVLVLAPAAVVVVVVAALVVEVVVAAAVVVVVELALVLEDAPVFCDFLDLAGLVVCFVAGGM